MVSEACCNRDRTQAVFLGPVIPAIVEVKGCLKRNRWHFCENIGTVWNGVRPALRCLDITCLCILSFLLKDFSQTEQSQLMSTPQEQNVDWERGRMLRIYIGFQATKFYCFPPLKPPLPPPPHFYCFLSSSSFSSSFLLFFLLLLLLLISIVFPPPPSPHSIVFYPSPTLFIFFSPRDSIKDCQLPSFVHFEVMSRVVNNNRGFLQLLAECPAYQGQFLLRWFPGFALRISYCAYQDGLRKKEQVNII